MDRDKLKQRLAGLLARATTKPEEEKDDARVNEARTSAYLFLKLCQQHGVRLKMILPSETTPPRPSPRPSEPPRQRGPTPSSTVTDDYVDAARRAWGHVGDIPFEELFKAARERVKKQQEEAQREAERRKAHAWDRRNDPDIGDHFQRPNNPRTRSSTSGAPPIITAQYDSVCFTCRKIIKAGQRAYWVKTVGCSHEVCGYEDLQRSAVSG